MSGASGASGQFVCRFDEIEPNTARKAIVHGVPVAVVRIGDDLYAIGDTCSHANISLSEGEVQCADKEIECWKHGSAFSLETGEPQTLPATQPVPVFVVRNVDGDVVVDIDTVTNGVAVMRGA